MPHAHTHAHSHGESYSQRFGLGVALNLLYVLAELAAGWLLGPLALMADAVHNLGDVAGLLLAWGGHTLARRPPKGQRTYGFKKASLLAAWLGGAVLLASLVGLGWEALRRLRTPQPVPGIAMLAVALLGVLINTGTALLFRGRGHDLNLRSAFLHMAADAAVSLGVVVAGVLIWLTGAAWVDPVLTLVIVALVAWQAWDLFQQATDALLDAAPPHLPVERLRRHLLAYPRVREVHDLHVWSLASDEVALTAHLVVEGILPDNDFLAQIQEELHDRFGIEHATLQLESVQAINGCRVNCH